MAAARLKEEREKMLRSQQAFIQPPPRASPVVPVFAPSQSVRPVPETNRALVTEWYFNRALCEGQWCVMWDPSRCESIPLVLDRSDRCLLFTDRLSHASQAPKLLREWNSMGFQGKNPFYGELTVGSFLRLDFNVQHSDPAQNLYFIDPLLTSVEAFHRPRLNVVTQTYIQAVHRPDPTPKSASGMVLSAYLRDSKSLSGIEGSLFVIEQTSEWPVFILNVGMGSLLKVFWPKANEDDTPELQYETSVHVLQPNQGSPFMAKLPHNQAVPALICPLFRVPLMKHEVPSTDFMLIRPIDPTSPTRRASHFYIRRLSAIYVAGMIEPHRQVMQPNTNDTRDFHKNFMKAMMINFFRGTDQVPPRQMVQISQIREEFFPDVGETKLRGILKDFSKFDRGSTPPAWAVGSLLTMTMSFKPCALPPNKFVNTNRWLWDF
jgi:hypothetical protein